MSATLSDSRHRLGTWAVWWWRAGKGSPEPAAKAGTTEGKVADGQIQGAWVVEGGGGGQTDCCSALSCAFPIQPCENLGLTEQLLCQPALFAPPNSPVALPSAGCWPGGSDPDNADTGPMSLSRPSRFQPNKAGYLAQERNKRCAAPCGAKHRPTQLAVLDDIMAAGTARPAELGRQKARRLRGPADRHGPVTGCRCLWCRWLV